MDNALNYAANGHSLMPIVLEGVSNNVYNNWLLSFKE